MQTSEQAVLRDIVLIGGGHSHVGVLRSFGMQPLPGVRLTVICTDTHTPYSGMLPGYIAGHYRYDEVHIDLWRLAAFAGARYYRDEVVGIDRAGRRVICRNRPPVCYDRLSINIGSSPALDGVEGGERYALPVKPIRHFNERWLALLERVRHERRSWTVAVVGAGAGGVELTLAMQYRLRRELAASGGDPRQVHFHLFSADGGILRTHNALVRRFFGRVLAERGVVVHCAAPVTSLSQGRLRTAGGETLIADEIVWATHAGAATWLRDTGLALDAAGFVLVRDTLQTVDDPLVFAAGDCAAMVDHRLEKAGVFAVREGRPLADNLRRSLLQRPLRSYRPQRRWLALISTGDRHAVASRGMMFARGAWVWSWKDWIDRRFMTRFGELPEMPPPAGGQATTLDLDESEAGQAISAAGTRCGGCGAKVGATVLAQALAALHPLAHNDVLVGLDAPDDAAIVRVPPGKAAVHTVDFFRSFVDDPWLFGRIAANHALGDIFAMGAVAQSATAIAVLPPGLERKVEDTLFQMLAGAVEVLDAAGCALVGGHSAEGGELALGFAINGLIDVDLGGILRKRGMRAGDHLLLSKPLGTGTLFAAHARQRASGRWIDAALLAMQQSNQSSGSCLRRHGASACSDVTGFGLLGHLLEMTRASGVVVELDLDALPALDGAVETLARGFLSSLHAANLRLCSVLRNPEEGAGHPHYPLLFDPQTAGGLLASVPAANAAACLRALHSLGYGQAACIGRALAGDGYPQPIGLKAGGPGGRDRFAATGAAG